MSDNRNVSLNIGGCILPIIGLIFLTLKLAQVGLVADWSWWIVLLPFYAIPAFVALWWIGLAIIAGVTIGSVALYDWFKKHWND